MANILDYLDWRGDLTLAQDPFNEVDNLILAELSFVVFGGIVPGPGGGRAVPLWKAAEAYFRKAGGTRLYLCTDSQCNYGFYDRHGFSRLDMCQSALPQALGGERMEFYLYEKDLAV